jgi:transcriptional regulator with XRE-family HTH domain
MPLDLTDLSLGHRIRVYRVAAGFKLWQLSHRAGIPEGRLSELENDRRTPRPSEWLSLCAILPGLLNEDAE